eukprot:3240341-Alexandrium_andersonii.AAC.1
MAIHGSPKFRGNPPRPSPVLPIHVLEDPGTPKVARLLFLGGVETLDEERRDMEVLLRDRDLSVASSLVVPANSVGGGDGLRARPPKCCARRGGCHAVSYTHLRAHETSAHL